MAYLSFLSDQRSIVATVVYGQFGTSLLLTRRLNGAAQFAFHNINESDVPISSQHCMALFFVCLLDMKS